MRATSVLFLITLTALMVVASRLNPNASGLGTHHQLGLPPCSVRVLWGIRCPSCGMTTSWAHLTDGNLIAAAHANLGGLFLALYLLAGVVPVTRIAVRGELPPPTWIRNATLLLFGVAGITLADWLMRLAMR